jgi:hypothetical protein
MNRLLWRTAPHPALLSPYLGHFRLLQVISVAPSAVGAVTAIVIGITISNPEGGL